jgi:predicted permease
MPDIIDIVLPTFTVIIIGYLIGRFTKISINPIVDIALFVGIPALVIVSLVNKEIVLMSAAKIWAAALAIQLGVLAVAWLVFRALRRKHSGLYVAIAMMNTVNIPFPIVYLAYGAEGLAAATLFYIPNLLLIYTLGIYIMAGRGWQDSAREVFRVPVLYAAVLGLVLNFFHVPMPKLALDTLNFISMMAIPLVLIILGHNLSRVRLTSFPTTLLASFLRIAIGAGIGLLMVRVLDIPGVYGSVVILISAMPAAATSAMLAARYDNEPELVSSVVLVTTVASVVVIPILLSLLG